MIVVAFFILRRLSKRAKLLDHSAIYPEFNEKTKESYFFDFEGQNLYYEYIKNKSATNCIVFIHGIGASSYSFRFMDEYFKDSYSILKLDLLGFGKSSKDPKIDLSAGYHTQVIRALLDHLEIENPVLVGSSMGGAISLYLAKYYPKRFPLVIAMTPAIALKRLRFFHLATFQGLAKGIGTRLVNREFIRRQLNNVMSDKSKITEEVIDHYYEPYHQDVDAMLCLLHSAQLMRDQNSWQELKEVSAKVLLLWGEKDKVTPIRHKFRFHKHFPKWQIKVHPDAGHHIHEDDPEWVAQAILNFIDSQEINP
ncbi:MAG: alpha/beta hydrolase [Bdellovibrionota bacterium]|nr:alpha/beta hydrolase [Bdellovibrionota bacterium]